MFQKPKTLDDVPAEPLSRMGVKMYIIGALVWDYADTVLNIAAQMRISATKKVSRAIRQLRLDYDRLRQLDLDGKHIRREWELAELFESISQQHITKLCNGLLAEIRRDHNLNKEYETLVEAVQIAMTLLDTLRLYAAQCDAFIRKYYPQAPHSILPDHFMKLAMLLPQYAGDCYDEHSQSRKLTAKILLNEINQIEINGRNESDAQDSL